MVAVALRLIMSASDCEAVPNDATSNTAGWLDGCCAAVLVDWWDGCVRVSGEDRA